jgi:hypothetical protein
MFEHVYAEMPPALRDQQKELEQEVKEAGREGANE